tara:strand:+ start:286 stop:1869 length:1584 start_codon:yes stop_codon:yes gene_type:complete
MKILISDPITEEGLELIKGSGLDVDYLPDASQDEKEDSAKDAHGWIIRSGTSITSSSFEIAKNLMVIGRAGVGVDNIDLSSATRKGVVVMNTPDANTISAAEHTVAIMLTLSRNIHQGHLSLQKGRWDRHKLVGTELSGKILGVIGLGKIGIEVIRRCQSFNMKIIAYDPYVNQEMFENQNIQFVDIDLLTCQSDYITIHVPFNNATKNLFNYERLSMMKPSAKIINVARGGIINESDLSDILRKNVIAGAAIDVFKNEPINNKHPLVGLKNVLLTPHLGASTKEAKAGVSKIICKQIIEYLINEKLSNAINMPIKNLELLEKIQPSLDLALLLGEIQSQISNSAITKVEIKCFGSIKDTKLIHLAFIRGLLKDRVPDRINYINAETMASELGISFNVGYSNDISNHSNIISTIALSADGVKNRIDGSIFDNNLPRLININNYQMEITPIGTMLFINNIDVPGVIGSVGTFLGKQDINIAAYILSRNSNDGNAFAVIRVDNQLSTEQIKILCKMNFIERCKQIILND